MNNILTESEKKFMEIFRFYKVCRDDCLIPGHIMTGSFKFLDPPDQKKVDEIIDSLVEKAYAYKKNNSTGLFLSEKGEKYLYE